MWHNGVELRGTVGERQSQAYFDTRTASGAPNEISGIVVFPDERGKQPLADIPIGVQGHLSEDGCGAQLKEPGADTDSSVWQLQRESTSVIKGTFRSATGNSEAIVFSIVPRTSCDGAGEWRTFSSPQWPITFDYPANWVLTSDDDDVNIECPSVAALALGGAVLTFERGRFPAKHGSRSTDGDPSGTEPYWFLRGPSGAWLVGDPGCAKADAGVPCAPARTSERNGITVLQGVAGEHRVYRPGMGYLGQGDDIARYLFVFRDEWVSLDSVGTNEHAVGDMKQGGPVLLDGDSVGDRLVRSVKLR